MYFISNNASLKYYLQTTPCWFWTVYKGARHDIQNEEADQDDS